jgi:hypothetical protein
LTYRTTSPHKRTALDPERTPVKDEIERLRPTLMISSTNTTQLGTEVSTVYAVPARLVFAQDA